jgi:hypothetical protein
LSAGPILIEVEAVAIVRGSAPKGLVWRSS